MPGPDTGPRPGGWETLIYTAGMNSVKSKIPVPAGNRPPARLFYSQSLQLTISLSYLCSAVGGTRRHPNRLKNPTNITGLAKKDKDLYFTSDITPVSLHSLESGNLNSTLDLCQKQNDLHPLRLILWQHTPYSWRCRQHSAVSTKYDLHPSRLILWQHTPYSWRCRQHSAVSTKYDHPSRLILWQHTPYSWRCRQHSTVPTKNWNCTILKHFPSFRR